MISHIQRPGVSAINDISTKYAVLWFKIYSTDHDNILHTSQQWHCCGVCQISLWSVTYVLN